MDAEYSARILGKVDPLAIKHEVSDERAGERTHPTFFPLMEQRETQVQEIQTLTTGEALVRLPTDAVHKVKTRTLPVLPDVSAQVASVKERYVQAYFQPAPPPQQPVLQLQVQPSPIKRRIHVNRTGVLYRERDSEPSA